MRLLHQLHPPDHKFKLRRSHFSSGYSFAGLLTAGSLKASSALGLGGRFSMVVTPGSAAGGAFFAAPASAFLGCAAGLAAGSFCFGSLCFGAALLAFVGADGGSPALGEVLFLSA